MPIKKSTKTWPQKLLNSKLVLTGSLVLLVVISVALGKAIYKRYEIQKEIQTIQSEIESAEGQNKELTQLIEYLATDSFREKMARQKLNLKREGETVIAIPVKKESEKSILGSVPSEELEAISVKSKFDNPKKWWQYLFSNY